MAVIAFVAQGFTASVSANPCADMAAMQEHIMSPISAVPNDGAQPPCHDGMEMTDHQTAEKPGTTSSIGHCGAGCLCAHASVGSSVVPADDNAIWVYGLSSAGYNIAQDDIVSFDFVPLRRPPRIFS